jgi:hypothetical protein
LGLGINNNPAKFDFSKFNYPIINRIDMDITLIAVGLSALVSGIISVMVFLYSQIYVMNKYRRKIIKVIFRGVAIEFRKENSNNLYGTLEWVFLVKYVYKFAYFFGAFGIISFLSLRNEVILSVPTFTGLEVIYSFAFIFVFLFMGIFSLVRVKKSSEMTYKKYILWQSLSLYPSDWISGWLLFVLLFTFIYFTNFKTLGSYSEIILASSVIFSFPFLFVGWGYALLPMRKYEEKNWDLEARLFRDVTSPVHIKIHTANDTASGGIIGIMDELVLTTNEPQSSTIYVPWENVLFFEIV